MFQQFFDKVEHGEFGPDTKLKDWVLDIICDDIRNALNPSAFKGRCFCTVKHACDKIVRQNVTVFLENLNIEHTWTKSAPTSVQT